MIQIPVLWNHRSSKLIATSPECKMLLITNQKRSGRSKKQKPKGQTPPCFSLSEWIWDHSHWDMPAWASTDLFFPCCTIEPRPPATLDEEKTPAGKALAGWVVSLGIVYNWKESGLQNLELSGVNPTRLVEVHSHHSGLYSSTWYNAWAMIVAGRWVPRN